MEAVITSPEIRRCARCGEPALICIRDWGHVIAGIQTPARTLELACQRCGAKVTLQPRSKIRAARILAYVMIPAVIPALIFFARARRMARPWTENPVVAGVGEPARRAADGTLVAVVGERPRGPAARKCQCGAAAPCVKISQRRLWDRPVGTRHTHACTACGRSFVVQDGTGLVFHGLVALGLCAAGVVLVADPPGSGVGAARGNQGFGVGLIVLGALGLALLAGQLRARGAHPPQA